MISFWQGHQEAIITTIIGIISSIYFYYIAKKDGDKTANEYKLHYQRAEKEIQQLKSRLEENIRYIKEQFGISLEQGHLIKNIDEKFSSRSRGELNAKEIYSEFMSLLGQNRISEAENYLVGKKIFIESTSVFDFMDAHLKMAQGNFKESIQLLDSITLFDKHEIELSQVYGMKATLYHEYLRDPLSALGEYKAAIKLSKTVEYLVGLADCYLFIKEYELAKQNIEEAVTLDHQNPFVWLAFARYNQLQKNYDTALEQIEKAHSLGLITSHLFVEKAFILEGIGDYDGALASYNRAKALEPESPDAIYNSGNLYIKLGDFPQAEIEFNNYRRLYPDQLYVLGSYFYVLSAMDKRKRIIEIGERLNIVEKVSECREAVNTLGLSYISLDQIKKGRYCFERLLSVYPNYFQAYTGLFFVYITEGESRDLDMAEYYCEKALQAGANPLLTKNHKALLFATKKDFSAAYKLLDEALTIDPNSDVTKNNMSGIKHFEKAYYGEIDLQKRNKMELSLNMNHLFLNLSDDEMEALATNSEERAANTQPAYTLVNK